MQVSAILAFMDYEAAKRELAKRYGAGDPDCPHDEITAQVMFSGRTEARCHRCMALIEPKADEALLPSMVRSDDDPETPGTGWKTLGYRLVKLNQVTVEPRMKFMGGGYVAQIAYRSADGVHTAHGLGKTRQAALRALDLEVQRLS